MKNKNSSWINNPDKIILLDNGSYEIKHSTANPDVKIKKFQNCKFSDKSITESAYYINDINDDIDQLMNINKNYQRPLSRGLLYDIDLECDIWDQLLTKNYGSNCSEQMLMFTHTPLAPDNVLESYFQIVFEYFGFNASIKSLPHVFTAMQAKNKYQDIHPIVQLVIDSGFSSTTIVPIFDNRPIYNAIKRIDISGKLLTNYMKEAVSFFLK